jgi:hypothetical protein
MKVSDMSAQAPVGTTLALLERQLKILTAVQARTHFSLKQEFKLLKSIIRDYTDPDYTYDPEYGTKRAKQSDYDKVDVIPVSDPNAATMSQRVIQYQAVIQMAQMAPQIYDLPQLHRSMLDVLGIKNAEKLVPLPEDEKPTDPVTENQDLLKNKPVKAFLHQDHQAHIAVHMMITQNPLIAQIVGQNPMAQQIVAAQQAHIAEHLGFQMRKQIEAQLGMPLPPDDEDLPPQVEIALSAMMAQAAAQVNAQAAQQAAMQQAQQQMQDPVVQMQQAELQLRAQELALKEKQLAVDATAKADRQALEEERVKGDLQLRAMKVASDIEKDKAKMQADTERDGVQLGVEIAKARAEDARQQKERNIR